MCLALPAKVIELLPESMAKVEIGGVSKQISLALLDDVQVGDYVVVHVGYALSRLDPEEAARTLAAFQELAAAEKSET
jgi:hydrogenase expression/formation protein HypC